MTRVYTMSDTSICSAISFGNNLTGNSRRCEHDSTNQCLSDTAVHFFFFSFLQEPLPLPKDIYTFRQDSSFAASCNRVSNIGEGVLWLGRSHYILRLTIPPMCWNHVRHKKKIDYSAFILFPPPTCHKCSLQSHTF